MRRVWTIAGTACLLGAACWAADEPAGDPVPAVWKEQHLSFTYDGRTARYSCDGLRDKMRSLLLDAGARHDLHVTATRCRKGKSSLRLVFSSPAPSAGHPGETAIDARFEPFTLTSDTFRNFGIDDCELVQDFVRQILPKLAARAVREDITCVHFQATGSRYFVSGEILRALR